MHKDSQNREYNSVLTDEIIATELGVTLVRANKYHDYFTSCLPNQQKGAPVSLGTLGEIPVKSMKKNHSSPEPLRFGHVDSSTPMDAFNNIMVGEHGEGYLNQDGAPQPVLSPQPSILNLYADGKDAPTLTINEFRHAVTLQRMLELDARGGTRYVEFLMTHFGVKSSDARLNRSEYLGGVKTPIGVQSVPQTSGTDTQSTPQANLSAFSATQISHSSVRSRTFEEHGYVIGLATIRYPHSYQQGIKYF